MLPAHPRAAIGFAKGQIPQRELNAPFARSVAPARRSRTMEDSP